uniref:Uncharacterized protein n=1 Tax=Caenorhabditis japonica TaxID=281687 RepID=A0A8R1HYC6_CAEJA
MMLQQVVSPPNLMPEIEKNEAFPPHGSVSSEEPTDRSSASPSNDDEINELMDEDTQKPEEDSEIQISRRLSGLETNFVYIQHQNNPSEMLSQLFPNASSSQLSTLLELSKMNKLKEEETEAPLKLGHSYQKCEPGKIHAERLSEPVKKSRKGPFGLPVTAPFHYRKDSAQMAPPPTPTVNLTPSANTSIASPGPSSDGDREEHFEMPMEVSQTVATTPTTPGANMFTQSMVDMLKLNAQNAAHSTGSPGFLRGRGRGRPKLIGDELDADLVDYMVSLKNSDPHGGHFTASQALHMARQYILERAPGLLEEHGGHVKLKLTWAMKLVSRIGERQKEIEYGLPAGTLSNMGRNLTNLPGGNFMTDMMAQNIFSQQMLMMNQLNGGVKTSTSSGSSSATTVVGNGEDVKPQKSNLHQNEENLNLKKEAAIAPEIVNIKELNIPFFNNFLAELNENHSATAIVDGEIGSTLFTQST